MTCFPPREERQGDNSFQQGDLKKTIYDDVNGDPYFAKRCENCFDLAALVVYHAVTVFLERIKDKDLQVFRVFEEYISVLVRMLRLLLVPRISNARDRLSNKLSRSRSSGTGTDGSKTRCGTSET